MTTTTPIRIKLRKGRTVAEYRTSTPGQPARWLTLPVDQAEAELRKRTLDAVRDKVPQWKATARQGFAPDMVRLPYLVRIVDGTEVVIGVNQLPANLPQGHRLTNMHGATVEVLEAL